MGLATSTWGNEGWHFIHCIAIAYPNDANKQTKSKYKAFFKSLGYVLPCPICSANFKREYDINPPKFTDSKELFNWTVDLHNQVNKERNKKEYTHEEAFNEVTQNILRKGKVESNITVIESETAQNGSILDNVPYLPIIGGLAILGGLYLISKK